MSLRFAARAFGLCWRSDLPLPGFDAGGDHDRPTIQVECVAQLADRGAGVPINAGWVYPDGIRLRWGDEVTFDMVGGDHIAYWPGVGWTGEMPASFYGTVAALTAAWRGLLPLHACAVEVDGRAVLIAGPAGAGKSTLTAGLVAAGAGFIADDLVVVAVGEDGAATVPPGRPTMRLHPAAVARLETTSAAAVVGDPRGKWLVRPRGRSSASSLPLGAVLILGEDPRPARIEAAAEALMAHRFRPRWLDALPNAAALTTALQALAHGVPVLGFPAARSFHEAADRLRPTQALAAIRRY